MKNTLIILFIGFSLFSFGQTKKDSIKVNKNLRFSILGGPGYTPDYGFLIGGSALFTFSTDKKDTTLKRSVLPIAFAYMTSGGGSLIIRPQLFLKKDRFRVFGQISLNNTIDNYYGVGYKQNSSIQRGKDSTEYRSIGYRFNPIFLIRHKKTDLFYGGSVDISHRGIKDPSIGMQNDLNYIEHGGNSDGLKYLNIGLGLNVTYDTRDVPANAYKGLLFELSTQFYSKSYGSSTDFAIYSFQYKQFKELHFIGKRKTLAWMLNGRFSTGAVPLTDLSMIGSAYDLRGYYMGQYRDKNALAALVEYRHMFNAGDETKLRRIASKFGFAAWAGMGTIDPDFTDWSGVLPNLGAGLRIELQPRMNFRVDIGYDPLSGKTLMYFNMTEAF